MNIIKCKLCREPFHSYGSRICPVCMEQIDKDFFTVRDYIYDNPNQAKVDQIAEATGVKEAHITYLIDDGRLSLRGGVDGANLGGELKCKICGRAIPTGDMCESCKAALSKELGMAAQSIQIAKPSSYVSPRSSKSD